MHMPQNILAETELKHLAAIPYQMISPSANSPIIGIYQDSLLGCFRFTRPNQVFTARDAMNLLMMYSKVDVAALKEKGDKITSFDILSQILSPMTLMYKTKLFEDDEHFADSNNVLEIRNGKYIRGQIEKSTLASTSKGILHRICNDFGHMQAANFIDDLQNVITEYMKSSSFSVGISDLISNKKTQDDIIHVITTQKQQVQTLIDKVHLGIFENNTAASNMAEFESNVNNILNEATNQAGKIGRKSLDKSNRFVMIVNSGSKGTPINISQMISCLGQTNVDGKRIPYGFDNRTLPHFSKFDDSPGARGFIENSYISGLTAPELFFHAMGGRIGLIDTAVKSVTWETPIVILENGQPLYIEIGRWIDQHLAAFPEKVQHFTERQMELLNTENIYIPTTDEQGVVSWGEVTAMTRHDPGDQLYEIKTCGGRSVIVTESKSLLIWDESSHTLKETSTPDIRIGDCVPVTESLSEPPILIKSILLEGQHFDLVTYEQGKQFGKQFSTFLLDYIPSELFMLSTECIRGFIDEYNENILLNYASYSRRWVEGIAMLHSRLSIYGKVSEIKTDDCKTWEFMVDKNAKLFNNVILDPITEIHLVDVKNHPKVYDLTIPSTLNFGLANGLQVRDTSQTGYIQRRLIKGLEDLKVEYDMTVRNNKGRIVQFAYGDDGFDSTRIENQIIPLVAMSTEDIYLHYDLIGINDQTAGLVEVYTKGAITRLTKQKTETRQKCLDYIQFMLQSRTTVVENVFKHKNENTVKLPVSFQSLISNIQGQLALNANSVVDITPLEAFQLIEEYYGKLEALHYAKPTPLFKILYHFYLTPNELLVHKRFHRKAMILLLETVLLKYKQAIVHPGEMVGVIAGQSLGEPTTQLSARASTRHKVIKKNKNTKKVECQSVVVGEFCDALIKQLPQYTFETGHKDSVETILDALDDEYYIVGVDTQEKTHWNKISHLSRHIVNGDMMKVTTKSGRSVETTLSHSHLIRDAKTQSVVPIVGADMKVGMRIPVAKHIDTPFIQDKITISGIDYTLNYHWGWFFGAYLSEGCLAKKKNNPTEAAGTITITNIAEHYIEHTRKMAEIFGKKVTIRHKSGTIEGSAKIYHGTDTMFSHKPLADIIMKTCGTGSFVKCVPDFAFLAPDKFRAGLIQGYFDGDGNFQHDKNHHQIRVCSRSLQLIKDMGLLLNTFGIFGTIKTNSHHGKPMHHLAMSARYAHLYKKHIGTALDKHKEKLEELVLYAERENAHNLSDDIDRINGLGDIIAKCGKVLEMPGQSRNYGRWSGKEAKGIPIGRRTLQKYIQLFEMQEHAEKLVGSELAILRQAADSNVIWDEIVDILVYTPQQNEYVYDFTVPGNQTFMTDYGIIVHNTLNSVTYETPILVRNSKGEIKKVKIGDFTTENIKTSPKIDYMADKDTTYAELKDFYEVPSATEDGQTVWRRIEAVTQHPVVNLDGTNTMLKVTTKGCREVTATKAKSFLQLIDGKLQAAEGADLRVGDFLPCSKKSLEYTESFELDLREFLPPTEYIYGSEMKKAKEVMHETYWWKKHAGKTFTLPYSRSDSAYHLLKDESKMATIQPNCVYMKLINKCDYAIPEKIPLDYNFGYLIGSYLAEGCCTPHQVSIANNELEYLKPIAEWCQKYNLTTKIYKHENKGQEGWTSQDIRIYSTVLCRIFSKLCGNLSHKKFVHEKIVFSNRECILGVLDAYFAGDGSISKSLRKDGTKNCCSIHSSSVSYEMLLDIQIMLKNLGIVSNIRKLKKPISNNRGTLPENFQQPYYMRISNQQCQKFAEIMRLPLQYKQERAKALLQEHFQFEYDRAFLTVPNKVNGKIVFEPRNGAYEDIIFDEIVSIEDVSNTTNYAYDLTVEDTRNFDCYNAVCERDTFHLSGVSSKSNVTRGVPRIEEILRLTKNPKNPSLTVHLRPIDELLQDKATQYSNMLEHTKLIDVIKSVQICFDPSDQATILQEDKLLMEQYYLFEEMIEECLENVSEKVPKSKWIVRLEVDAESLLEKNITMDDIHFAITSVHGDEISCVFSDYNANNLVFRIRLNSSVFSKSKKQKGIPDTLDQSDEIYMLRNFQDSLLNNIVLRGIQGIRNVIPRKLQNYVIKEDGKYSRKDVWILDTTGTNLMSVMALDYIDASRTYSNDINEIFNVLGLEAARQVIYNEFVEVMEFSDVYINYHHLSLLCDRMTSTQNMVSIFRSGILNDDIGPISKSTFEVHTEVLLDASRHAEFDHMRGVSASVMMGQMGNFGTGSFQVVLDMEKMKTLDAEKVDTRDKQAEIERLFGQLEDENESCAKANIEIKNHLEALTINAEGVCDDGYDMGF